MVYDGAEVPGGTNRFLFIASSKPGVSGNYNLVATGPNGSASSDPIQLTISAQSATYTMVGGWGGNDYGQCTPPHNVQNPRAIAAGNFHTLVLDADGTVVAWGKDVDGQTNVPPSATNIVAIAAGGNHSLALGSDGSVIGWGRDWDGQIDVPAQAGNATAIAAGSAHSLALRNDGTVVAWGNDDYGQTDVPARATNVIAIAAGYFHSLALLSDQTVISWGLMDNVPANLTNVVGISAGWWHSLAVDVNGTVTAWGDNSYGQCDVPSAATNIIAVAAGYYHSLALRGDGTVLAWGAGYHGETTVPASLANVVNIAAGEDFSLVLVELGPPRAVDPARSVLGHAGGQLVLTANMPGGSPMSFQWFHDGQAIEGATNRDYIGSDLGLSDAGTYVVVGSNPAGQTTNQAVTLTVELAPYFARDSVFQNVPIGGSVCLVPEVLGAQSIAYQWQLNGIDLIDGGSISGSHTVQLCLGGAQPADSGSYTLIASNANGVVTGMVAQVSVTDIVAWGDDGSQQIEVPSAATNVVALAAGGDHSLALRRDGVVVAWGDDSAGQTDVPDTVTNVVSVAAGSLHSVAVRVDGSVVAWGDNSYGQTNVPSSLTNAILVAAGANHTIALRADGTIVGWGANNAGQTNTTLVFPGASAITGGGDQSLDLVQGFVFGWGANRSFVPGRLSNVTAIAAGANHALALTAGGAVIGWGNNYYGQISIPSFATKVVAIAAGDDHSLAVLADGSVVGWGANYSAQSSPPALTNALTIRAGRAHSLALLRPAVSPGPPRFELLGPSLWFDGAFRLRLSNLTGLGVTVITASTNLVDWQVILTNLPTAGTLDFIDPESAAFPQRFYRAFEQR